MSDPVADLITRIKNAQLAKLCNVDIPHSNFKLDILSVMKKNFIIEDSKILEDKPFKVIKVNFGSKKISHIKRLSKPGRRYYVKANQIPSPLRGLGLVVMSTPKGVISGFEAKKLNIGGELICEVW